MIDKARRIVRKYVEFIITKVKILWEQRVFIHEDVKVKYILKQKENTDTLAIVFSACTRKGLRARYNYVKTLNGLNCNRLYILDDYAEDHRGSYYMGENFKFNEEKATKALIHKIIADTNPKKIVFCGSSKGGYAAMNFGMDFPNSIMVVGAPQYYLTSYLLDSENLFTLQHILGERSVEKDNVLEYYLRDKIKKNPNKDSQIVYLHFSDKEHTYEEHIKHMIKDMEDNGYRLEADVASYTNHSDLSYYFPDFLKKHIKDIIEQSA